MNYFLSQCLVNFFVLMMHGLIYYFTAIFLTRAIKCTCFVEAVFCWQYVLDLLHWNKCWISLTSFWSVFFDGDHKMDTILVMINFFLSSVCFCLFPTDAAWDNIFSLVVSGNYIGIFFWKNGAGQRQNGCNYFMIQWNGQCSTACV